MAADYWASTQFKYWLFKKDTLYDIRDEIDAESAKIIKECPLPDRRLMLIFIKDRLHQLGKRMPFRQQCVATALMYVQRYLLSTALQNINIYLLTATAFYLASKTEESPHHIRLVAAEARNAWPEYISGDVARIGEMEFSLISEMRSQLTVWHPYRTLVLLKDDQDLNIAPEEFALAWAIINDSYLTDLPLTCPPHVIAIIGIFLAILFVSNRQDRLAMSGMQRLLQTMPTSGESSTFISAGGLAGLRGAMSNALNTLPVSQLSSFSGSQPSSQESGRTTNETEDAVASERIERAVKFLSSKELDIEQVIEATQEIISLYEIWEQYNDKTIREAVTRCYRGRGIDS